MMKEEGRKGGRKEGRERGRKGGMKKDEGRLIKEGNREDRLQPCPQGRVVGHGHSGVDVSAWGARHELLRVIEGWAAGMRGVVLATAACHQSHRSVPNVVSRDIPVQNSQSVGIFQHQIVRQ
jgi:hypothetical protein